MEYIQGIPLSSEQVFTQEDTNPEAILKLGLKSYLKMVFSEWFFSWRPARWKCSCFASQSNRLYRFWHRRSARTKNTNIYSQHSYGPHG